MLSNTTNQPKSTEELCYICPRGLLGPPAATLTKKLKYEKRHLLICINHFKSDLINNMDHMRISGIEPSSVTHSQTKWFQTLQMIAQKCQIKLKPKGWCNKPPKLQFQSIVTRKILMLSNTTKTEVDRRTLLHVPSGTPWSTYSDTHQVVKI